MRRGVFCIESDWYPKKLDRQTSVRPMLELLEREERTPVIYRDCGTISDLKYYINQWALKRYAKFQILYLAVHGDPEMIYFGQEALSLEELADILKGLSKNRIIVLGTCATLKASDITMQSILKTTKASMVCGYSEYVDWIPSTAFELALMNILLKAKLTPDGIEKAAEEARRISKPFELGFKAVTKRSGGTRGKTTKGKGRKARKTSRKRVQRVRLAKR